MADIQKERAAKVEDAYRRLQGNKDNLGNIPGILRQLVTLKVWEGYEWQGKTVSFGTFREFVETPPPEGLGTTVEDLIGFCRKYPEIADIIDQKVQEQAPTYRSQQRTNGRPASKRRSGTFFQRAIRRLRELAETNQRAKQLYDQVLKNEISASSALLKLGKMKRRYAVEATPESVESFVRKRFNTAQKKELIDLLKNTRQ